MTQRLSMACGVLSGMLLLTAALPLQAAPVAAPTVGEGKKVAIEYTLFLQEQEMITTNAGQEPLVYEHGKNEILPGLERALEGMRVGDRRQGVINPEEGYGPQIEEAVVEVDVEKLPQESREIGALVQLNLPDGQALEGQVTEVNQARATVDFNHPLAGQTLYFDVTVVEIR